MFFGHSNVWDYGYTFFLDNINSLSITFEVLVGLLFKVFIDIKDR